MKACYKLANTCLGIYINGRFTVFVCIKDWVCGWRRWIGGTGMIGDFGCQRFDNLWGSQRLSYQPIASHHKSDFAPASHRSLSIS